MKDLIKEVALEVCKKLNVNGSGDYEAMVIEAGLAELSKRAEAVHWRCVLSEEQRNSGFVATPTIAGFSKLKEAEQFCAEKKDFKGWDYKLEPLFTFPPIHDIEIVGLKELLEEVQKADDALSAGDKNEALIKVRTSQVAATVVKRHVGNRKLFKALDIEAIENRVAEACAKYVNQWLKMTGRSFALTESMRSGEWRKYK